jgi:hypothetical protein
MVRGEKNVYNAIVNDFDDQSIYSRRIYTESDCSD